MPYNSNNNGGGGPWGGGGGNRGGGKGPWGGGGGGGGGGGNPQGPDLDDMLRKGRDQLKVILGGKGGGTNGTGRGGGGSGFEKYLPILIPLAIVAFWLYQSTYRVDTSEQSVEMFFGKYSDTGTEGLNFAPWPVVTYEKYPVTVIQTETIGQGSSGAGLMLTGDENFVDIEFSVGWNVKRLDQFLFNLDRHSATVQSVSESVMREIIARSDFQSIVNVNRGAIEGEAKELIQRTLDAYGSGINVEVVNFEKADPPPEVREAFLDVQAAEQDRRTKENQAQGEADQKRAIARGERAQLMEDAEAYRAQVVNQAQGEASRFIAVYNEYIQAPEVTRKRLYLETLERVMGDVNKIIIDEGAGGTGQGVVPYLPLNELRSGGKN